MTSRASCLSCAEIGVLVVDDHPVMREGVAALLAVQPDMRVVGEASSGLEAIDAFGRLKPTVTLMDLQMPHMGGLEAIEVIRREHAAARIIVLTTYSGDVQAMRALKAGAAAYLLKTGLRHELIDTIRTVAAGRRHFPAEVATQIALHAASEALTSREVRVLEGVARGQANKQIGRDLGVTEDTVKAHLKTAFLKLGVSDRTHAVIVAMKRGIIQV